MFRFVLVAGVSCTYTCKLEYIPVDTSVKLESIIKCRMLVDNTLGISSWFAANSEYATKLGNYYVRSHLLSVDDCKISDRKVSATGEKQLNLFHFPSGQLWFVWID